MQEQLKQPAIKTFTFENDRLISVSDKILDGNVKGSTLNFMESILSKAFLNDIFYAS